MTPEEVAVMDNPEAFDAESVQYVAAKYTAVYAEMKGINVADIKLFDDEQLENEQGKNVKASDTTAFATDGAIYLEADRIQENGNLVHALGHENKRQDQIQKGVQNDTKDGVSTVADKEAYAAGEHAKKAFELEKRIKKPQQYEKATYVRTKADNDAIEQGSKQASKLEDVQPWVFTPWDVANLTAGTVMGVNNLKQGNYADAALDGLGVIYDAGAVALPGPGGAATAIKAWRYKKKLSTLVKRQKVARSNRVTGKAREKIVQAELEKEHGVGNVLKQRMIVDKHGKKIKDPITGEGRILDHVVVKDGKVVKSIETTSLTADKRKQLAKEKRIRKFEKTHIKKPGTKEVIEVENNEISELYRRE